MTTVRDRVGADAFRALFRGHAGGVVVVTFDGGSTTAAGFTATSLTSVSLEPPMVSFAISNHSSCWPQLQNATSVVINFLSHDQDSIARTFAARGVDRFATPLRWRRLESGEPVLSDSRRWLRAQVRRRIPVGDHQLVVAEIAQIHIDPDAGAHSALVYHDGAYHSILRAPRANPGRP
jgi:flavin reductase (DIM6/NTAB) family NADH-FMN oxidoreductase RutF